MVFISGAKDLADHLPPNNKTLDGIKGETIIYRKPGVMISRDGSLYLMEYRNEDADYYLDGVG